MNWLNVPVLLENMGECDFRGCTEYDMGDCFIQFCFRHGVVCGRYIV